MYLDGFGYMLVYAAGWNYVFTVESQASFFEEDVFGARFCKSDPGPSYAARARNLRSNA